MTTQQYLENINQRFMLGNATEHTFRGDLQTYIEYLCPEIQATNEPKRQACGAPDYILTKKDIPIGFIEAKNMGDKDLEGTKKNGNKEQFDRYKLSLNNLIFTDYLTFYFYRNTEFITKISIANFTEKGIEFLPENFIILENLLKNFVLNVSQSIQNSQKLAEIMAAKARLLSDIIEKSLISDEKSQENSSLKDQMNAFKEVLIHDIIPKTFADVYAQTITYGLFAARLHDTNLDNFSRQKAYELIPKTNPFLKKLFGYMAGFELDDRIKWVIDDLVAVFLASNVAEILKDYGKDTKMEEPIIHFYENFLSEYDPNLRKARGVWYTPAPVVNFIVRAVDDLLKTEFNLSDGLADNSKVIINAKGKQPEKEVFKVQILDPATGTGTFLAEIIKQIYQKFETKKGIWNDYVENNLLPRLNGFELLMASYAMAHLQLDLLLRETGFTSIKNERLRIFLTNSLEESTTETPHLFMSQWLTEEGKQANIIKKDTPVMCVLGNPPYSGESINKSEWIMKLMEDYKKEPHSNQKLKEKNPKWLNDDYVKFIRYGQHYIEKNNSGILAFINPHGFLDNPTFRGMRWSLLKTFDKIYTIDLHGNSKKKEVSPDGTPDANVFDIMQGVSINIFIKTGKKQKDELAKVLHFDLFGKREFKYNFLNINSLSSVPYQELPNIAPNYFFVNKNFEEQASYQEGFSLNDLFPLNSVGIVTARDNFTIHSTKEKAKKTIEDFLNIEDEEMARNKFDLGKDTRDWQVKFAKKDLQTHYPNKGIFTKIAYRPFDDKWTFYTGKSKGFHCYPRNEVMQHFLKGGNVGLVTVRRIKVGSHIGFFVTNQATDDALAGMSSSVVCPLYLYPQKKKPKKVPFISEIDKQILMANLEYAENHFKQVSDFFHQTLLTFYQKIEKTTDNEVKLFEENRSIYEEAKATFEKLKKQFESYEQPKNSSTEEIFEVDETRKPNLNLLIINQIAKNLDIVFTNEKENMLNTFAPIDVLDYIYAVLHSFDYREKYKEFLKIDFPNVPYPKDKNMFWELVKLGKKIREIHLLDSEIFEENSIEKNKIQYVIEGDNIITKIKYENKKVFINETQYFENVPNIAWEFYIGGYQPAQKWLKDRKKTVLTFEDILHYQKIIIALIETDKIMNEIQTIFNT